MLEHRLIAPAARAVLLVALVAAIALSGAATTRGAPATAEWQPTGLTETAWALFAPASGALFAKGDSGLFRSDDAGATWRQVPLPPGYPGDDWRIWRNADVAIDPNDHTRVYVGAWVTRDDAATWGPLRPSAGDPDLHVRVLPSAADPNLLYLAVTVQSRVYLLRSRDAGATEDTILELGYGSFLPQSTVVVTLFEAHPTDPNVLFQSIVGFRGRGNQGVLRRSADQGETFQAVLSGSLRVPAGLVGGRGSTPDRFYAAMTSDETSSALYRSDDGGVTWTQAATFGESTAPAGIWGLTYDPAAPDRLWVGLTRGGVQASEDGGQSWTSVGPADWSVTDLALGVDGANLYAATTSGVFRLPLR